MEIKIVAGKVDPLLDPVKFKKRLHIKTARDFYHSSILSFSNEMNYVKIKEGE
jgi:hypothetical protein